MNEEMKFLGYGAYLYGALAIIGLFVAGIYQANEAAYLAAILAAASSYVAQYAAAFRAAGRSWGGKLYGVATVVAFLLAITAFISLAG